MSFISKNLLLSALLVSVSANASDLSGNYNKNSYRMYNTPSDSSNTYNYRDNRLNSHYNNMNNNLGTRYNRSPRRGNQNSDIYGRTNNLRQENIYNRNQIRYNQHRDMYGREESNSINNIDDLNNQFSNISISNNDQYNTERSFYNMQHNKIMQQQQRTYNNLMEKDKQAHKVKMAALDEQHKRKMQISNEQHKRKMQILDEQKAKYMQEHIQKMNLIKQQAKKDIKKIDLEEKQFDEQMRKHDIEYIRQYREEEISKLKKELKKLESAKESKEKIISNENTINNLELKMQDNTSKLNSIKEDEINRALLQECKAKNTENLKQYYDNKNNYKKTIIRSTQQLEGVDWNLNQKLNEIKTSVNSLSSYCKESCDKIKTEMNDNNRKQIKQNLHDNCLAISRTITNMYNIINNRNTLITTILNNQEMILIDANNTFDEQKNNIDNYYKESENAKKRREDAKESFEARTNSDRKHEEKMKKLDEETKKLAQLNEILAKQRNIQMQIDQAMLLNGNNETIKRLKKEKKKYDEQEKQWREDNKDLAEEVDKPIISNVWFNPFSLFNNNNMLFSHMPFGQNSNMMVPRFPNMQQPFNMPNMFYPYQNNQNNNQ